MSMDGLSRHVGARIEGWEMRKIQMESCYTVLEAARLLSVFDSGCITVLHEGTPVGEVTERDFVQRVLALELLPQEITLGDLLPKI